MKTYLDMDGVLADFDRAMLERNVKNRHDFIHKPKSEWSQEERDLDIAVSRIMTESGFWSSIPPMRNAHDLVKILDELYQEVWILTARPNIEGTEWVADVKCKWIHDQFDGLFDEQFICCLRSEKKQYATENGHPNLLVDDMLNNCKEWQKAGGVAVHWK